MVERDLTALSRAELIDLFLEANEQIKELSNRPKIVYIDDPEFVQAEKRLFALVSEICKRYHKS